MYYTISTHNVKHKYTGTNVSSAGVVVEGVDSQSQTVDVEKRLLILRPVHPIRDVHLRGRQVSQTGTGEADR